MHTCWAYCVSICRCRFLFNERKVFATSINYEYHLIAEVDKAVPQKWHRKIHAHQRQFAMSLSDITISEENKMKNPSSEYSRCSIENRGETEKIKTENVANQKKNTIKFLRALLFHLFSACDFDDASDVKRARTLNTHHQETECEKLKEIK